VPTRRPQPAKALLVLRSLTNRDIARLTGRSEQYVGRVLNGYMPPSQGFARDLAAVLDVRDTSTLFDWVGLDLGGAA
jgi:transcriptional regulator with XRE-family HTH domain